MNLDCVYMGGWDQKLFKVKTWSEVIIISFDWLRSTRVSDDALNLDMKLSPETLHVRSASVEKCTTLSTHPVHAHSCD